MPNLNKLAINGGEPVRKIPMPKRHLIGVEEREMLLKIINKTIETGDAFRYAGEYEDQYEREFRHSFQQAFSFEIGFSHTGR